MTTEKIISDWLSDIQIELIKNYNRLGLRASGNWEKQLEPFQKQTNDSFSIGILGAQYTGALENGRKPTTGNEGNPTLKEVIRIWIDDKGIIPKDNISKDSLAFLIARKIHEDGIKVPNRYNAGGLVSDVVTKKSIEDLNRELSLFYVNDFKSTIIKDLK